jgi:hypothetical protein
MQPRPRVAAKSRNVMQIAIATAAAERKVSRQASLYFSAFRNVAMQTKKLLWGGLLLLTVTVLVAVEFRALRAEQGGKYNKLADEDRKVFAERFQKEVWPLLIRHGKDGCVGCHNGKKVTTLRFSGDPAKDFPMLVADGYLLKGDPGSLLERITDKDKTRVMPPDGKHAWTADEIQLLRAFVNDVDKKNR